MAVRLHRVSAQAAPAPSPRGETPSDPERKTPSDGAEGRAKRDPERKTPPAVVAVGDRELRLAPARSTPARPHFPSPPTGKLAPPRPIELHSRFARTAGIVVIGGLAGAAILWGALTWLHRAPPLRLRGTVLESHRELSAPGGGRLHAVVAPGTSVETGETIAILLPTETPRATPVPDAKRLEESLHRAEAALSEAKTHLTGVEQLYFEERATRSEKDDAARDVRFRQGERDRLTRALASVTSAAPATTPRGTPITADAPMTILSFAKGEGARLFPGDAVASIRPRAAIAEAALGKTRAPEEGTPVRVRIGEVWVPGVISGIHVEGDTRTVSVSFDATAEPGAAVEIAAAK